MVTPANAAEKFARSWLAQKDIAIMNYVNVASTLAQKAINEQASLLTNFTDAVNSGRWANGLRKYIGNNRMGNLYTDKLNSITEINDAEKLKIEESVRVKQYLRTQLAAVLTLFKNATGGDVTVPPNLSDVGLNSMLMSGIISFEGALTDKSTPQQIYTTVEAYMGTHYGWPDS